MKREILLFCREKKKTEPLGNFQSILVKEDLTLKQRQERKDFWLKKQNSQTVPMNEESTFEKGEKRNLDARSPQFMNNGNYKRIPVQNTIQNGRTHTTNIVAVNSEVNDRESNLQFAQDPVIQSGSK